MCPAARIYSWRRHVAPQHFRGGMGSPRFFFYFYKSPFGVCVRYARSDRGRRAAAAAAAAALIGAIVAGRTRAMSVSIYSKSRGFARLGLAPPDRFSRAGKAREVAG